MKKESKVANSIKDLKDSLDKLSTLVLLLISFSKQMLLVFFEWNICENTRYKN